VTTVNRSKESQNPRIRSLASALPNADARWAKSLEQTSRFATFTPTERHNVKQALG
jgi:hypothetical protein